MRAAATLIGINPVGCHSSAKRKRIPEGFSDVSATVASWLVTAPETDGVFAGKLRDVNGVMTEFVLKRMLSE